MPVAATCCGFGGDRGLLHPELAAAATADQAAELAGRSFDAAICSNRTCEIGLQAGTGLDYESFVFVLEELTRVGGDRPAEPWSGGARRFGSVREVEICPAFGLGVREALVEI